MYPKIATTATSPALQINDNILFFNCVFILLFLLLYYYQSKWPSFSRPHNY
jgi:hypothetical protein